MLLVIQLTCLHYIVFIEDVLLVGTKTFCLSEEKKMIDEYSDSSGYDPSSEEDEEGDMQDECRSQENNDSTEEQESAVGKQGNVGGEKMKKKQKQHKVNN